MKTIGYTMLFGYYIYFMFISLSTSIPFLLLAIFMPPVAWVIYALFNLPSSFMDILWLVVAIYLASKE